METLFLAIDNWWLILALILAAAEMFMPGMYLFWIALAFGITGIIHALYPLDWRLEGLITACLIPLSLYISRRYFRPDALKNVSHRFLNRRADRHIGRVLTLNAPIVNGEGQIMIAGVKWRLNGPDIASGRKVRITGTQGTILLVSPENTPQ